MEEVKNHRINKERICFVAGMPRAATTFLYHTLANHTSIYVPARKELDFFSVNHYRGEDWYLSFFKHMAIDQVGFDISPMNFFEPKSAEMIYKFNPGSKVILLIREPIGWIISFYKHLSARSYRSLKFEDFIKGFNYKKDAKLLRCEFEKSKVTCSIKSYIEKFKKNLLLINYRTLKQSPMPALKAIEKFTCVSDFFDYCNVDNIRINSSDDEPPKFINILMQQKFFSDMVTKIFPKRIILKVRLKLQVEKHKKDSEPNGVNEIYRKTAKKIFSSDIKYIDNLFKDADILLGDGKPLD